MEPVFRDGSTVAIDQADTYVRDGKIYAINHDGLLRIKILEKMPGNQIKIKSYNIGYDDEIVSQDEITILGRVWWQSSILDWEWRYNNNRFGGFFIPKTSINLSRSPHTTTFDNFILNLITFIIDIINNLSYHYHIKTNQLNNKVKQDYELFN